MGSLYGNTLTNTASLLGEDPRLTFEPIYKKAKITSTADDALVVLGGIEVGGKISCDSLDIAQSGVGGSNNSFMNLTYRVPGAAGVTCTNNSETQGLVLSMGNSVMDTAGDVDMYTLEASKWQFQNGENEMIYFSEAGDVGVGAGFDGSNNPTAKLEVKGSLKAGSSTPLTVSSTGDVAIANTTASTSKTTGAFTVAGGVGVAGAVYAGSFVSSNSNGAAYYAAYGTYLEAPSTGPNTGISPTIELSNSDNSAFFNIRHSTVAGPASRTSFYSEGSDVVFLSDTTNAMYIGKNGNVAIGGPVVATAMSAYSGPAETLSVGGTMKVGTSTPMTISSAGATAVANTTASTTTTTGALTVAGGVGVAGQVTALNTSTGTSTPMTVSSAGATAVANTTASTTTTTGALTVAGGVGVAGQVTALNTSTGTSTPMTVSSTGATAVANTTASTTTTTGALTVAGGVGVAGQITALNTSTGTSTPMTVSSSGVVTLNNTSSTSLILEGGIQLNGAITTKSVGSRVLLSKPLSLGFGYGISRYAITSSTGVTLTTPTLGKALYVRSGQTAGVTDTFPTNGNLKLLTTTNETGAVEVSYFNNSDNPIKLAVNSGQTALYDVNQNFPKGSYNFLFVVTAGTAGSAPTAADVHLVSFRVAPDETALTLVDTTYSQTVFANWKIWRDQRLAYMAGTIQNTSGNNLDCAACVTIPAQFRPSAQRYAENLGSMVRYIFDIPTSGVINLSGMGVANYTTAKSVLISWQIE